MKLEVALSFLYGILPPEMHSDIEKTKILLKEKPLVGFNEIQRVVQVVLASPDCGLTEAVVTGFLWGVAALYASGDERVEKGAAQIKAYGKNVNRITEKLNQTLQKEIEKVSGEEPVKPGGNVIIGSFPKKTDLH